MPKRSYWLFKSEPDVFSFEDLLHAPQQTTFWDGVRNYQARNYLRDTVAVGDRVLFYYSNAAPAGVAGLAEVVRAGYPDHTAFDTKDPHFDPKSRAESPTWYMVDVKALAPLPRLVTIDELKTDRRLAKMVLLNNSRLSVQPVTAEEYAVVLEFAGMKDPAAGGRGRAK